MKKDTEKNRPLLLGCQEELEETGEDQSTSQPPLLEDGSVTTRCNGHTIHCLTIIGQIEGHYILPSQNKTTKYEHVIPQIVAVEEDPQIDGLLMLLNTVGGDVEAGLALAELVAGMKKPTVSLVLGGGHSIGVPLAVAAKRSFIAESASGILPADAGQDNQLCHTKFQHYKRALYQPFPEHPGAGDGRGHRFGRPRRRGGGPNRFFGLPFRRHRLPGEDDRPGPEAQKWHAQKEESGLRRTAVPTAGTY